MEQHIDCADAHALAFHESGGSADDFDIECFDTIQHDRGGRCYECKEFEERSP